MNSVFAELLTLARRITNYDKDGTAGGRWITTTNYTCTVPAGKRWYLFGGNINRAPSSTCSGAIYDSGDAIIHLLCDYSAGTGSTAYPETANVGNLVMPIPMDEGDYFKMAFGTAQDANAYGTCLVLEIDV